MSKESDLKSLEQRLHALGNLLFFCLNQVTAVRETYKQQYTHAVNLADNCFECINQLSVQKYITAAFHTCSQGWLF